MKHTKKVVFCLTVFAGITALAILPAIASHYYDWVLSLREADSHDVWAFISAMFTMFVCAAIVALFSVPLFVMYEEGWHT